MAHSSQISLLAQLLPVQLKVGEITIEKARKYVSELTLDVQMRGKNQCVTVPLMYEVQMSYDWVNPKGEFRGAAWQQQIQGGQSFLSDRYPTPEVAKNALGLIRPKNALVPTWEYFNFDGIVYTLAAMLGTLSMHPGTTTKDFRNHKSYAVKGINQMEDMTAVLDEGGVFLDPRFVPSCDGGTVWAIITAANIAGARVILPYADCDADGRVLAREYKGAPLIHGITVALNLLGTYYSMASLGDIFALAVTKGIHTVLSVVGHSDEGGITRDLLRLGQYAPPFGGLPMGISMSSGMPVIDGHYYEELCSVVDSIALTTAALVAHCDPMVNVDGELFPTTLSEPEITPQPGAAVPPSDRAQILASLYSASIHDFAANYVRGLSRLFNLQVDEAAPRAQSQLVCAAAWLDAHPTRHFGVGNVLVPYFWIEPTTILPKKFLGSPAELGGSGSLAGWHEVVTLPFFNSPEAAGPTDTYQSDWYIDFKSARTSMFILYALNHAKDGLANFMFKGFDSARLCLTRLSTAEIREKKDEDGFVNPADLLWRRGQSKIPHPGELLNIDARMALTVCHSVIDGRGYTKPVGHIPRAEELHTVRVILRPGKPRYWTVGDPNFESSGVQRLRNRGIRALERAQMDVLRTVTLCGPGAQASERPPPKKTGQGPTETVNDTALRPVVPCRPQEAVSCNALISKGVEQEARGEPTEVARQHGALVAPRPHEGVQNLAPLSDGGAGAIPPPDNVDPRAQAAANPQTAAPDHAGAAPAP